MERFRWMLAVFRSYCYARPWDAILWGIWLGVVVFLANELMGG